MKSTTKALLGTALLMGASHAIAGDGIQQGFENIKNIIALAIEVISVVCVIGGFVMLIMGLSAAYKKSKPQEGQSVTAGQIFGGILGGPALAAAGFFLYEIIDILGADEDEIGTNNSVQDKL